MFTRCVVGGVIGAVGGQSSLQLAQQGGKIFALRVPIDIQRLDFGAQEMVRAAGADLGQAGGVVAVDKFQHAVGDVDRADEPRLLRHQSAQRGQQPDQQRLPLGFGQRLVFCAAKSGCAFVAFGDVFGGAFR
jgi:hypothetical protein